MDFSYSRLLNNEEISLSDEENIDQLEELEEKKNNTQKRCSKKSIILISSSLVIFLVLCGTISIIVNVHNINDNLPPATRYDDNDYPTFEEINERVKNLQKSLEKIKNVSVLTVGHSTERNPIRLVAISPLSDLTIPLVWMVCGVHAREWTVPYTCLHFLQKLNTIFQSTEASPEDHILSALRYKFILVANPDGYIYSMSGDRMARKNRHLGYCSSNEGVDLNRNFPVGFQKHDDFCSNTYAGPEPFSEPESRAIRDSVAGDVPWLFLSVHGNAQVWTSPYAYKMGSASLADTPDLKYLVEKIQNKFGTSYRSGSSYQIFNSVGGTLQDWVYENLKVTRTFLHELRSLYIDEEAGINHFQPPFHEVKRDILPEAWYGFKTLVEISYKNQFNMS